MVLLVLDLNAVSLQRITHDMHVVNFPIPFLYHIFLAENPSNYIPPYFGLSILNPPQVGGSANFLRQILIFSSDLHIIIFLARILQA